MNLKEKFKKIKNRLPVNQNEQVQVSGKTTVKESEDITEEEKKMLKDFHKFREGYISPAAEAIANYFARIRNVNLDAKVDNFIDWYTENMVKGHYTDIDEYHFPIEMRNFIEKMAVWYELRYPDYEINRLMSGSNQEMIDINDVMFNSNRYINELFDENADVRALDWNKFYNIDSFIDSLPAKEKKYLQVPKYRSYSAGNGENVFDSDIYFDFDEFGNINGVNKSLRKHPELKNIDFMDMNIELAYQKLCEMCIPFYKDNSLEKVLKQYNNDKYFKEEMLNCVMYRIIERGGNRIGPRRAFIFAKEFGRNIDIPMTYGVDRSDLDLRLFMNEYIKAGGSKNLVCYIGYGSRASKYEKLPTITIQELIMTQNNNAATFYTPEEDELHQRLVNTLSNQINQDDLLKEQKNIKKEEVRQLRLQRKLEKSKQSSK